MKTENRNHTAEAVSPIPEGYHTVTPYLMARDAKSLVEFMEKGLGGSLEYSMKNDNGTISHATVRIGDSLVMVGEQPAESKPTNAMLYLYVEDVDSLYQKAIKVKGAKSTREPKTEFYGDRAACVTDAWGNQWWISTHVEDVSEAELKKRKDAQPKM